MGKDLFKLVFIPLIICFILLPFCSKNSTAIEEEIVETEEPEINPKALSNLYEFLTWSARRHPLLELQFFDDWVYNEKISERKTVWRFKNQEKELIITETRSVETTTNFQVKNICDNKLVLSVIRFYDGQIMQEYYNGPSSHSGTGGGG